MFVDCLKWYQIIIFVIIFINKVSSIKSIKIKCNQKTLRDFFQKSLRVNEKMMSYPFFGITCTTISACNSCLKTFLGWTL